MELQESKETFDIIFIDYFQRVKGVKALSSSWESSIEVADKLLDLAIKLDTVIVVGSQKNRTNKDDADTSSISGGDGLSNVCNVMMDIKRESGANNSQVTVIKDRESQFMIDTKVNLEINDNFITINTINNTKNTL